MSIEELLLPRYKVIKGYPRSVYEIGEIIKCDTPDDCTLHQWPHIFQPLKWWEHRTLEQLKSIRYMKVVEYSGYWLVGDVVPVKKMAFSDDGFLLGYWLTGHLHPLNKIVPATEEEYNNYKAKKDGTVDQ